MNPFKRVKLAFQCVGLAIGGLWAAGAAVYQVTSGWMGDGFVMRFVYPPLLLGVGLLMILLGGFGLYGVLSPETEEQQEEEHKEEG